MRRSTPLVVRALRAIAWVAVLVAQAASATVVELLPPTVTAEVAPVWSPEAVRRAVGGQDPIAVPVTLEVELDDTGRVSRVVVQQASLPTLGWAAMGALTGFSFTPAMARHDDGRVVPTAIRFAYTMHFELPAVPPPPPPTGIIRGAIHVTRDESDIAGAHVHVVVDGREQEIAADGLGDFVLPPLPAGEVELLVDAPGFVSARAVVRVVPGETTNVIVHLDRAPSPRETVVQGRATRESVRRTLSQSVAVVDGATLARVRGRTLADTLAEVPGVTMVQSGPQQQKPVVRGLFGRRLVMLTDGVRHEGQDWGLDHAPEIDPHSAGQLTVVKGAAGVRYGADAIGGVILVDPRPMRLDPGLAGELFVSAVDNGLRGGLGGRVDLVLPQLPALTLRLEGNTARGGALAAPDYVLGNTASAIDNVGATAEWRSLVFERAVTARLSYRHHEANLGVCYCLEVATPEALQDRLAAGVPPGASSWTMSHELDRPRQRVAHDTIIARVEADLGVGTLQTTWSTQVDDRDEFDQVRGSVVGPQFSFLLVTHALDVTFRHQRVDVGPFAVTGTAGARGDLQLHAYEGLQLIPNFRRFTGGVFGLERFVIDDALGLGDLEFMAGARMDGLSQTSFLSERAYTTQVRRGRLEDGDCALSGDVARCDKTLPAASVTVGSRWHLPLPLPDTLGGPLTDAVTVQLDLSSAARFPDVDELYLGGRAPSLPVAGLGDAGLETERTWQVSLGGELRVPGLLLEVGAFASRINDYIAFGPELGPDGRPVVDVLITGAYPRFSSQAVEAVLAGVDGGAILWPEQVVSLALQGAYVQGSDLTHDAFLPFIPPPQLRAELRLQPDERMLGMLSASLRERVRDTRLATGVVVVARQERFDARSDFAPPPPGYTLWNASLSTETDAFGLPLQLGIEGRNLLNTRYRDPMSLMRFFADQPGREVWLRASVRVDDLFDDHDHDSHSTIEDDELPH